MNQHEQKAKEALFQRVFERRGMKYRGDERLSTCMIHAIQRDDRHIELHVWNVLSILGTVSLFGFFMKDTVSLFQ